jgi:hypothetical protein
VPFELNDGCLQAIAKIKHVLTHPPVLAHEDPTLPYYIHTDASALGVRAVLTQTQDGVERVIRYASRKLNPHEQRYGVTELECLAVVFAVEKFHSYIWGTPFYVVTDHTALEWLRKTAIKGRLYRWVLRLSEYDFIVKHRPGKDHGNADCLSRLPVDDAPSEETDLSDRAFCFAITRGKAREEALARLRDQERPRPLPLDAPINELDLDALPLDAPVNEPDLDENRDPPHIHTERPCPTDDDEEEKQHELGPAPTHDGKAPSIAKIEEGEEKTNERYESDHQSDEKKDENNSPNGEQEFSPLDVAKEQRKCPKLAAIIKDLEESTNDVCKRYRLRLGLLEFNSTKKAELFPTDGWRVVVPETLRRALDRTVPP